MMAAPARISSFGILSGLELRADFIKSAAERPPLLVGGGAPLAQVNNWRRRRSSLMLHMCLKTFHRRTYFIKIFMFQNYFIFTVVWTRIHETSSYVGI